MKYLSDFIDEFYKNNKYGQKYLLSQYSHEKADKDEELKLKWFSKVMERAASKKFIDRQTLDDVWNLDPEMIRRLMHDNPLASYDITWSCPFKNQ